MEYILIGHKKESTPERVDQTRRKKIFFLQQIGWSAQQNIVDSCVFITHLRDHHAPFLGGSLEQEARILFGSTSEY